MTEPGVITYSLNPDPPGIMNSTSLYNNSDAEGSADDYTLLEWARNFVSTEVSTDTKNLPSNNLRIIMGVYCLFIILQCLGGTLGNLLVIGAVIFRPNLRNASFWTWYPVSALCKTMPLLASVSVFVSTLSITAITLDRMWVICYSQRSSLSVTQIVSVMPILWILAFCMSYPQAHYKELVTKTANEYFATSFGIPYNVWSGYYETFLEDEQAVSNLNLENAEFCCNYTDNFDENSDQTNFSRTMMHCCLDSKINISEAINFSNETISTCQEEFPPLYRELRRKKKQSLRRKHGDEKKFQEENARIMRASKLLFSITIVFVVCWVPLNFLNLLCDWFYLHNDGILDKIGFEEFYVIYSCCHIFAMACTVINPILYGFFNENFRREILRTSKREHQEENISLVESNLKKM